MYKFLFIIFYVTFICIMAWKKDSRTTWFSDMKSVKHKWKKEKERYVRERGFITGELLGQKIRHGPAVAYCWYAHTWCRLVTVRLL